MHTHTPQGENIPKNSHPGVVAARGCRKIFFGHTQCVHTYDCDGCLTKPTELSGCSKYGSMGLLEKVFNKKHSYKKKQHESSLLLRKIGNL